MILGFRIFISLAPVAILILIVAFFSVWQYRKELAAQALLVFFAACMWLLVCNTLEMLAPIGFWTIFFAKLQYLAYAIIPIAWVSFSLRFTGWITYLNPKLLFSALFLSLSLFVIVFTNDFHGLVWRKIAFTVSNDLSVLKPSYGPIFWLIAILTWICIGFGTIIVFRSYVKGEKLYYRQSILILLGALLPGIANIIYTLRILPIGKDFTPLAFALSGVFFTIGMYMHHLLWIMPVARGVILQELNTAIIAIDEAHRIIDHNTKADALFSLSTICVGRDITYFPILYLFLEDIGFSSFFKASDNTHKIVQNEQKKYSGQTETNGKTLSWIIQFTDKQQRSITICAEDISEQASLTNELNKTKRSLEKSEKLAAIGQISAGIAHEINNPLGFIRADIRSLQSIVSNEVNDDLNCKNEILEIVIGIDEGLERISKTVQSLLEFSRSNENTSPKENLDLNHAIQKTLSMCQSEWKGYARIQTHLNDIPVIQTNKNEIEQVLLNLLSNAAYAIRKRYEQNRIVGTLTITSGSTHDCIYCEISNTGDAIITEVKNKLFEPFFTTKEIGKGTGLGLSISKDIIEKHHKGRIFLLSSDPVCFRFELPIQEKL